MIQANELRIGNLLLTDGRIGTSLSFSERKIRLKLEHSTIDITSRRKVKGLDVDPIPLTEEWLLKFGFEYDEITYSKGPIMLDETNTGSFNVFHGSITNRLTTIQHVHQLQNLYFCITGEELTIKTH